MNDPAWRSYFSPREWAVFTREAARRGVTAEDLAVKYVCRAIDRIELATKYGKTSSRRLDEAIRQLRRATRQPPAR